MGECAGSWDACALADHLAAGLAADRVYDSESVDELAWAMQAQLATLAGSPAIPVLPGLARILLSCRTCPASLPPRRVPGVSPSCSTLARHTASSTLARLRRSVFRRRLTRAPTSVMMAAPGGTQDLPAPVLAHLDLGDT